MINHQVRKSFPTPRERCAASKEKFVLSFAINLCGDRQSKNGKKDMPPHKPGSCSCGGPIKKEVSAGISPVHRQISRRCRNTNVSRFEKVDRCFVFLGGVMLYLHHISGPIIMQIQKSYPFLIEKMNSSLWQTHIIC